MVEVGHILFNVVPEAVDQAGFQLAGAFLGDPVFLAQILQRDRRFRQDAVPENVLVALGQRLAEFSQFLPEQASKLPVGQLLVGGNLLCRQDVEQRAAVVVLRQRLIERDLPTAHPLVHLDHVAFADVEPVRQQLRVRREAFPLEPGLFLAQIVEELALILGRADLEDRFCVV